MRLLSLLAVAGAAVLLATGPAFAQGSKYPLNRFLGFDDRFQPTISAYASFMTGFGGLEFSRPVQKGDGSSADGILFWEAFTFGLQAGFLHADVKPLNVFPHTLYDGGDEIYGGLGGAPVTASFGVHFNIFGDMILPRGGKGILIQPLVSYRIYDKGQGVEFGLRPMINVAGKDTYIYLEGAYCHGVGNSVVDRGFSANIGFAYFGW